LDLEGGPTRPYAACVVNGSNPNFLSWADANGKGAKILEE